MGISGALFAGVSGLNAISTGISVIADNIANVNTIGFKASSASFSDLLSQTLREGVQIGRGGQLQTITQDFSQGSLQLSNNPTNLAIDGKGFFIVNDGTADLYTRAGEFSLNNNGELVNPAGLNVQGFQITGGVQAGNASNISFATTQSAPQASTTFQIGMNLDARTTVGATFRSAITVFDSLGDPITLTITFTNSTSSGTWTWAASASDGTTANTGTVAFDGSGNLTSPASEPTISITGISTGASDLSLTWDILNTAGATNGSITGYAANSVVNSLTQDGFTAGSLRNLAVDSDGVITGLFTNGQTQQLYRLALASFTNPAGLTKLGRGVFAESAASGAPVPGTGNSGGFGSISSNSLELSNVDLAKEFVDMITAQRGFQANTRVITTVDDLLNEVVNLRR